jgi:hypothetical protein
MAEDADGSRISDDRRDAGYVSEVMELNPVEGPAR